MHQVSVFAGCVYLDMLRAKGRESFKSVGEIQEFLGNHNFKICGSI